MTLVCVVILVLYSLLVLITPDNRVRLVSSDVIQGIVNLFVAVALFYAAYESKGYSKRLGMAWLFIAIGQLSYAFGDICYGILEISGWMQPFPSFADIFYLIYYPNFFFGIVLLSLENQPSREKLKNTVDMTIIMLGASLVSWLLILNPIMKFTVNDSLAFRVLTIAYPVCDLGLFAALIWLLNSSPKYFARLPIVFLLSSTFITIVVDSVFSFQSALGIYNNTTWTGLVWLLSYLLTGVAALHQIHIARTGKLTIEPNTPTGNKSPFMKKVIFYFPYIWAILAYLSLYLVKFSNYSKYFDGLFIGVGLIICLVILRQFWAFLEIKKLNSELNAALNRVQLQSQTLEKTNHDLESEIQQRMRVEEKLSYDALHDPLTDLPNRAMFIDHLEKSLSLSRSNSEIVFSVLFMDIDQFKVINDSLGHALGDQLLVIIAKRLVNCLRSGDIVARLGGDEFVFIIQNTTTENIINYITGRIQEEIHKVIFLDQRPIYITTSIGIVWNLRGYENSGNVLRDADLAMYQAKRLGKDRYEVFQENLRLQAISRLQIEENLRKALSNNEMELFYQPIQDLSTKRIVGFEALLRWNHPTFGLLCPNEFLSIAEEAGLSQAIGKWTFTEACTQLMTWQEKYPFIKDCFMDVNVSGTQFCQTDFIDQEIRILNETKVDPSMIRLEITESTLIEFSEENRNKFAKLRAMGLHLTIDDFGTGYSSLSYVKNFPVQSLKIDKSFIGELGQKKSSTELVKSMITLGQDLGLEVIAEGIESSDQVDALLQLSCKYGQGFLLSLPLPADEVEELLREGKQFLE